MLAIGDGAELAGLHAVSVLILDDNRHMRELLRGALTAFGFQSVHESEDVETALAQIARGGIDIALVDYRLSQEEGTRFCRAVRNDPDKDIHFLPLIMVTGYADRVRLGEAINSGIDEYLVKPVTPVALARRIGAVVERRRPFVRSQDFFGPDRRRRADRKFAGPYRRADDDDSLEVWATLPLQRSKRSSQIPGRQKDNSAALLSAPVNPNWRARPCSPAPGRTFVRSR